MSATKTREGGGQATAAQKRTTKGPGAAKPARQSVKAPDPSEESAATAANSASRESKQERWGPPVVGIGASAGGLVAFKRFFNAMSADSGIAFVLVPHLDPAQESLMVELLARHTAMPLVEAENDMPVEANYVYIIPPNKYITIHGGKLSLTGLEDAADHTEGVRQRLLSERKPSRGTTTVREMGSPTF
jgi:two-component system CheB/CheR fusion protein